MLFRGTALPEVTDFGGHLQRRRFCLTFWAGHDICSGGCLYISNGYTLSRNNALRNVANVFFRARGLPLPLELTARVSDSRTRWRPSGLGVGGGLTMLVAEELLDSHFRRGFEDSETAQTASAAL